MSMIPFIEELAANAWRPEIEQFVDGWRLRYSRGITRRELHGLLLDHLRRTEARRSSWPGMMNVRPM